MINPETIAAIQMAGQALNSAGAALVQAAQDQGARVADAVASNAFGVENDAHFDSWKAIARMSQTIKEMEAELRNVYFAAGKYAFDTPALQAPRTANRALRLTSPAAAAEDVVEVVPSKAKRLKAKPKVMAKAISKPLKGNAAKVWSYLQTALTREEFGRITHGEVVKHAAIPLGSVGASIAALKAKGHLVEGERGSYRVA